MAITDTTAPKNIPSTGALGIGSTAGVDRSINLVRNIKRTTTATSEGSMDRLRNWFNDYVGTPGGFTALSGSESIALSQWRGARITGFSVQARNETSNPGYDNNNDGRLTCQGFFDDKTSTKFKLVRSSYNSTKTAQHGNAITFTGIDGDSSGEMTLTITNSLDNEATMLFKPKRSGTSYMKSTTTVGRLSSSDGVQQYNFSSTAEGGLSNTMYFTFGLQAMSADRVYGAGYTYP